MGRVSYWLVLVLLLSAVRVDAATVVGQPTFGGYTTAMLSRLAAKVPTTRTINGHALSADITVTAADVGALASGATATDSTKLDGQVGSYYQTALGYTPMKTDYSNAGTAPTWNQNTTGYSGGTMRSNDTSDVFLGAGTTTNAPNLDIYGKSHAVAPGWASLTTGVADFDSGVFNIYKNDFAGTATKLLQLNSAGNLAIKSTTLNSGSNTVFRCVGGTNNGALNWSSSGPCSGGTNTATSLNLD